MMNRLPTSVRVADVIHRLTVYGLFGVTVVGAGGIVFNIYANSDYASWNKDKATFDKQDYEKMRLESEEK